MFWVKFVNKKLDPWCNVKNGMSPSEPDIRTIWGNTCETTLWTVLIITAYQELAHRRNKAEDTEQAILLEFKHPD